VLYLRWRYWITFWNQQFKRDLLLIDGETRARRASDDGGKFIHFLDEENGSHFS